jgi:hypothetical protein
MRRHSGLWERIISPSNIQLAYKKSILGKSGMRNVIRFNMNKEVNLETIRKSLEDKTFTTSKYMEKTIYEPKRRTIYVLPFSPDRVVQHAIMNILEPIWEKFFIKDSFACLAGRGLHAGSRRTMEFVRRNAYCLKCDISKFYPSVNQEILFSIIKRKIKCKDTLWLLDNIIKSFPGGKNVPIGNYTSQWFGNLYLNELDQYVKHTLKIKDYVRYCDDFILFSNDKGKLHKCAGLIKIFLDERLKLKMSKCDLFPVKCGVDFLGYRHFNNYILLRKSTMKRVRRRLNLLPQSYVAGKITGEQFRSSVWSTWGWLKHANSHNLMVALRFKELLREVRKIV